MPLVPAAPPIRMAVAGGFGDVAVDAVRRRVYAAHTGSGIVLVVDADTRAVLAKIPAGAATSVAVEPLSGHLFVGTADGIVSEIDPVAQRIVRSLSIGGPVAALAYDAELGRLYADARDAARLWVVDTRTLTLVATVTLPGRTPASLAIDPQTHDVYQNVTGAAVIAVVDAQTPAVRARIATPELETNSALVYDPALGAIVAAGTNGVLGVYDRAGFKEAQAAVPAGIDRCSLDAAEHIVACASGGDVTLLHLTPREAPALVETAAARPGVRGLAFDAKTHALWTVSSDPEAGDLLLELTAAPKPTAGGSDTAHNSGQSL